MQQSKRRLCGPSENILPPQQNGLVRCSSTLKPYPQRPAAGRVREVFRGTLPCSIVRQRTTLVNTARLRAFHWLNTHYKVKPASKNGFGLILRCTAHSIGEGGGGQG